MRVLLAVLCFALLFSSAAFAQQNHNYGNTTCYNNPVNCPDSGLMNDNTALAASANSCLLQIGSVGTSDIFEESGLDSSGCLTSKSVSLARGIGSTLYPHCCVVKNSNGNCYLHCSLDTVR